MQFKGTEGLLKYPVLHNFFSVELVIVKCKKKKGKRVQAEVGLPCGCQQNDEIEKQKQKKTSTTEIDRLKIESLNSWQGLNRIVAEIY